MSETIFRFETVNLPAKGSLYVPLSGTGLSGLAEAVDTAGEGVVAKVVSIAAFKGKADSQVEILAPAGCGLSRLVLIGARANDDDLMPAPLALGGRIGARLARDKDGDVVDLGGVAAEDAAMIALGIRLRGYAFDKYRSSKDEDARPAKPNKVTLLVDDPKAVRKAMKDAEAIGDGVILARDLVNEPANVLGPLEFAEIARSLAEDGVEVTVLDEKEMEKLGMRALLGVAQGSVRPPRLAVMRWNGAGRKKPVAFVGKGVVFDTGGISIKPAASMEDMKGDMGGAAAVTGLMKTLARRKAKVNAIGVIGLVENMPDGNAQRPGDIVTAMNGVTIEVINTDAEGRLVLADALHYTVTEFKPVAVINLATLTGAILVALAGEYAGLFSNDDALAGQLLAAGAATGDKLWRMPIGPAYDKMIESRFADIKNTGGRWGGASTAAVFLQRFIGETPWAHLDVAGTAMGSPKSPISTSWASGYGVQLLDRYVRDVFEG